MEFMLVAVLVIYLSTQSMNSIENERTNEQTEKMIQCYRTISNICSAFGQLFIDFPFHWSGVGVKVVGKYQNKIELINNFVVPDSENSPAQFTKCTKKKAKQNERTNNLKSNNNEKMLHKGAHTALKLFTEPFKFISTFAHNFLFLRDFARFSNFPRTRFPNKLSSGNDDVCFVPTIIRRLNDGEIIPI